MSADAKIMEALARIEHKLDILLNDRVQALNDRVQATFKDISPVGSNNHYCPLCTRLVEYQVDPTDAVVFRKCGCSTGKVALDMKAFAPPVSPTRKNQEDEREQEDGRDSTGRRGLSKGR